MTLLKDWRFWMTGYLTVKVFSVVLAIFFLEPAP